MSLPTHLFGGRRPRLLRAGVLVLVCALGGGVDVLSSSFATLAARMASFPEEEEHGSKDRSSLIATFQLSRKGTNRPSTHPVDSVVSHRDGGFAQLSRITRTSAVHRTLTGAGIFQNC